MSQDKPSPEPNCPHEPCPAEVLDALAEAYACGDALYHVDIEWTPWRSLKTGISEEDGERAVAALTVLGNALADWRRSK